MATNFERAPRSPIASPDAPALDESVVADMEASFNLDDATDEIRNPGQNETAADASTNETESTADTATEGADFYSKTAVRITNGASRITAVLEKLSAGAPARQEARAEKLEAGKETLKKVGRGALRVAKFTGIVIVGLNALTLEYSGINSMRDTVVGLSAKARQRLADRSAARTARRSQNEAFASYEPNVQYSQDHAEADEMNKQKKADQEYADISYGPNVRYSQDHAEAYDMNEQKKDDQNAAYDSYSDNIDATQRREAQEAAYDSYDGNIKYSEALERKRIALARREARKARFLEKYGKARDKGSELYARAKGGLRRFGKSALNVFKRTVSAGRAAAGAAVSAGAQAWKESAAPAQSN